MIDRKDKIGFWLVFTGIFNIGLYCVARRYEMSKAVLTAFGGKLKGVMEIPENFRERDLYLIMDMETPSFSKSQEGINLYEITTKRGRFEATSGHKMLKDGSFAQEYKLVEIQ